MRGPQDLFVRFLPCDSAKKVRFEVPAICQCHKIYMYVKFQQCGSVIRFIYTVCGFLQFNSVTYIYIYI